MPRTKEFDVDTALQAALELFWRQGYEVTSVNEIVEHLGIAKASLYATFGSKHELYVKALDRYACAADAKIVMELSSPGPALPSVRGLVLRYVDEIMSDHLSRGCLVVNAAVERLPGDLSAARIIERSWDTLQLALTMALSRARAQGELPPDRDPAALARFLLAVLQGLRVLGKGLAPEERLRDAATLALGVIA